MDDPGLQAAVWGENNTCAVTMCLHGLSDNGIIPAAVNMDDVWLRICLPIIQHVDVLGNKRFVLRVQMLYYHSVDSIVLAFFPHLQPSVEGKELQQFVGVVCTYDDEVITGTAA